MSWKFTNEKLSGNQICLIGCRSDGQWFCLGGSQAREEEIKLAFDKFLSCDCKGNPPFSCEYHKEFV